MITNPFFLLSVLASAVFAFFAVAFIVEILIRAFRIRLYRTRSMMRLLPFLGLVVDLLFNQYSISYWINPLNCASCVQKLVLEVFFPQVKAYLVQNQISLINHLGFDHQHVFFAAVFVLLGTVSLVLVARKLIQAVFSMYKLHSIEKRAFVWKSSQLAQLLQKNKVSIYLSNEIQVPLTVYPKSIIIPEKTVGILSEMEFEAVIAHEWEHIKYHDSLARLLTHLVAAFFWWVGVSSWIKKLEQEQELSCDQNVLKYGVTGDLIASALFKVARQVKMDQTICCFTSPGTFMIKRMQEVLGVTVKSQSRVFGLYFFGVVFGGVFFLICMMYL